MEKQQKAYCQQMAKKWYTKKENKVESILNFEDLRRKTKTKANSFLITDSLVKNGAACS